MPMAKAKFVIAPHMRLQEWVAAHEIFPDGEGLGDGYEEATVSAAG